MSKICKNKHLYSDGLIKNKIYNNHTYTDVQSKT